MMSLWNFNFGESNKKLRNRITIRLNDEIFNKIEADPQNNSELIRNLLMDYYSQKDEKNLFLGESKC